MGGRGKTALDVLAGKVGPNGTLSEDLLREDFSQCFSQMRHYDEAFRSSLQYAFAGVIGVVAAYAALIGKYGCTEAVTSIAGLMLLLAATVGVLIEFVLARNRVYYASFAHYVNEIRALYLTQKTGGLENKSGMYCDYKNPPIFNPGSTQTVQIYILALFNSVVFSGAVASSAAVRDIIRVAQPSIHWTTAAIAFFLFLIGQVSLVLIYWHRKNKKTADKAVFGK